MAEFFFALDNILTNSITWLIPRTAFFDYLFLGLSFDWLFIVLAALLFLYFLHEEKNHTRQFVIYFLVSFVSVFFLANIVIKSFIQRDRPYIANNIETLYCPSTNSFPSSHTAVAFAGAAVLAYFDKKRRWFYYSLALLVGLSRIYLHCHYFFDVFTGAFLGYMMSKVFLLYISDNNKI